MVIKKRVACHQKFVKYEFPVKVLKVRSTHTIAVLLLPENVPVQELTLVEVHKKFTGFGWARLHITDNELVIGRTYILREGQIISEMLEIMEDFYCKLHAHHKLLEVVSLTVFQNNSQC